MSLRRHSEEVAKAREADPLLARSMDTRDLYTSPSGEEVELGIDSAYFEALPW